MQQKRVSASRVDVVLVTPSVSRAGGGVSEAVRLLSTALAKREDIAVRVLALHDKGPTRGEGWDDISVQVFPFVGSLRFAFSPRLFFALLRTEADVYHVHGIWKAHCLATYLASRIRGIPYVVTPHGMMHAWIRARSKYTKRIVSALYQRRFLQRASAFHLLTEAEKEDLVQAVGLAPHRVIPNYVTAGPRSPEKPAWWTDTMDGKDIFLFLGRIHDKKGCLELCEAWLQLCESDSFSHRSVLVFCGEVEGIPEFEPTVREIFARHGNIYYMGPQYGEQKGKSLAAATFFCLPSKSEGLPLTILEAWAVGTPTLITDACNLPVGFSSGAALRISSDVAGIREGLIQASQLDNGQREAMGAAALHLVATSFSEDRVVDSMVDLYRSVISRGNPEHGMTT